MKQTCMVLVLLAAAGLAMADDITLDNGLKYAECRITGVNRKAEVEFTWSGRRFTKPLAEVKQIVIEDDEGFNKAEKALAAGKYADAAGMYDIAYNLSRSQWLKELVRYRRLAALDAAGKTYEALEDWLALMESAGASDAVRKMAPKNLPKPGSTEQKRVQALLETHRSKAQESHNAQFVAAIDKLLKAVQEGGASSSQPPAGGGSNGLVVNHTVTNGAVIEGDYAGSLKIAANVLKKRTATPEDLKRALNVLNGNLGKYGHSELSGALLLRGQARQRLAQAASGQEQRTLWEKAGLDYMRVAVLYPDSPEAAQAMYLAGGVNEALGNSAAARNAYEAVLSRFKNDTKTVARAKAALKKLDKNE